MKIFNCETKNRQIKKMTLDKVIKAKRAGNPVKIIGIACIKDKTYGN